MILTQLFASGRNAKRRDSSAPVPVWRTSREGLVKYLLLVPDSHQFYSAVHTGATSVWPTRLIKAPPSL